MGRRAEEGLRGQDLVRGRLRRRRRADRLTRHRPPTNDRGDGAPLGEALRRAAGPDARGCVATARGIASRPRGRSCRTRSRRPTRSRTRRPRAIAAKLLDELGDLLFQVYFLALLLEEEGTAISSRSRAACTRSSSAVTRTFSATQRRDTAGRVRERWEEIKSEQEGRAGIFHDVPASLPALLQARKLQRRAVAAGFDWPDLEGPLAKIREELGELEAEVRARGEPSPETEPDPQRRARGRRPALHGRQPRPPAERRSRARASRDEHALRRASRACRGARGRGGRALERAAARATGPLLRPGEGATSMSSISRVHGRQILDSRGNPTVEVDVQLASGAFGPCGGAFRGVDRRARGRRTARRRLDVGWQGRDEGGRERRRDRGRRRRHGRSRPARRSTER